MVVWIVEANGANGMGMKCIVLEIRIDIVVGIVSIIGIVFVGMEGLLVGVGGGVGGGVGVVEWDGMKTSGLMNWFGVNFVNMDLVKVELLGVIDCDVAAGCAVEGFAMAGGHCSPSTCLGLLMEIGSIGAVALGFTPQVVQYGMKLTGSGCY